MISGKGTDRKKSATKANPASTQEARPLRAFRDNFQSACNTITTVAMTRIGKVFGNLMVDLRASNEKLRDRAMRILAHELDIDRAAAAEVLDALAELGLVQHADGAYAV